MQPRRFALIGHEHNLSDLEGDSDDITEGSTNFFFTNERAEDVIGAALTDTDTIDLTYTDNGAAAGTITARVKQRYTVGACFTNGTTALVTPTNDVQIRVPTTGTLRKLTILAQSGITGACVLDVWKDTYGNFPPVVGDSMVGGSGTVPQITVGNAKYEDSTFTNWTTTAVTAGDTITFHLTSASVFSNVVILLDIEPS